MEQLQCRSFHTHLHLPEELVVEILLRLPAKSVARFRCVSTGWLSISTDPSFILAHARHAPKSWLVRSINNPGDLFHNLPLSCSVNNIGKNIDQIFSFSVNNIGQNFDQISSHIPRSSLDGLVLFWRGYEKLPQEFYVMNLLTGFRIDLPNPSIRKETMSVLELYYHRWTGEYRLINLCKCKGPSYDHLHAEVLSLADTCSWRQVQAKEHFVSPFYWQSRVFVNDHLYWTCLTFSKAHTILVFDILKETFSLMELPSYGRESFTSFAAANSLLKYGLVDMQGILYCWIVYIDKSCLKNVKVDVWAAVGGDDKWKITYSLCLIDEFRWAFCYPCNEFLLVDSCLCISERELLFLFDTIGDELYLFHWDLKSGKYWNELLLEGDTKLIYPALTYKETLVNVPFSRTVTGVLA